MWIEYDYDGESGCISSDMVATVTIVDPDTSHDEYRVQIRLVDGKAIIVSSHETKGSAENYLHKTLGLISTSSEGKESHGDSPSLFKFGDKNTIDYLKDLFGEKLRLYDSCKNQASILAAVNAVFIGALALLINNGGSITHNMLAIISFSIFLVSLGMTIWYTMPKFISYNFGVPVFLKPIFIVLDFITPKYLKPKVNYKKTDHRSVYGIDKFESVEDYKNCITSLTPKKTCDELVAQIYNMNDTICINYRAIRIAVAFDLVGLVVFMVFLACLAISKMALC
ncbi:MAG: hypothetical protein LBU70_04550 [Chitinispirillales bacterium]|jgi:hypothetical protein|nr:hypothetical protein [Chitinispirillales bacterium]